MTSEVTSDRCGGYCGLHVLVDDDPRWKQPPVAQARAACEGGAAVVQLRAKLTADARVLAWAREIRALTREHGVRLVVNDRYDLALACDADAVHLGQEDLPPDAIPPALRSRLAIGRSTHTLAQVRQALGSPVDYLAVGPVYGTTSKQSGYAARGLALVGEAAALAAPRPLVAIGGITAATAAEVVRAGARGIAVISAVAGAPEPVSAVRALCAAIESASR